MLAFFSRLGVLHFQLGPSRQIASRGAEPSRAPYNALLMNEVEAFFFTILYSKVTPWVFGPRNRAAEPSRTPRTYLSDMLILRVCFRVLTSLTHYASSTSRYHLFSASVHSLDPTALQWVVGNWCQWGGGGICAFTTLH